MSACLYYGQCSPLKNGSVDFIEDNICSVITYCICSKPVILIYIKDSMKVVDHNCIVELTHKDLSPELKWRGQLFEYCKKLGVECNQPNWHLTA